MDKSLYKGISSEHSLLDFDKYIVHSQSNKAQLYESIRDCQIDLLKIRCDIWRLCLGIIDIDSNFQQKSQQLQSERDRYQQLLSKHLRKGNTQQVLNQNPVLAKNPLGRLLVTKPVAQPTKQETDDAFLEDEVRKDVERTYQQRQFFKNPDIIKILSKEFPDISYKQGMNEIGASVMWVYFLSAVDPNTSQKDHEGIVQQQTKQQFRLQQKYLFFHSNQYAQADVYSLFDRLMNSGHKQMFRADIQNNKQINPNSKNNSPILQRIIKLSDIKFKIVDGELFRHMKLNEVTMRPFLLKWFRCIHTREFELEQSFPLWDNIFLAYHAQPDQGLIFIDYTTLAMLVYLRDIALKKDARFQIVQLYQKYPKIKGKQLQEVVNLAWTVKDHLQTALHQENQKKKELKFNQNVIGEYKVYQQQQYNQEKQKIKKEQQAQKQKNTPTSTQQTVKTTKVQKVAKIEKVIKVETNHSISKPNPVSTTNNQPKQSLESEQPKQNKQRSPLILPVPSTHQRKQSEKLLVQQKKTHSLPVVAERKLSSKVVSIPVLPPQPAVKQIKYQISFNHSEWAQVQELMKKSIEQNRDLQSRSITMKIMKIFLSKEQQETKRMQNSQFFN